VTRRSHIDQISGRLESLQQGVGDRVAGGVGEVDRGIDRVANEVTEVGRGVVSALPADAVRGLIRQAVLFARAAAATAILGGVMIGLTTQLDEDTYLGFLAPHKVKILVAEVGLVGVLAVELLARAVSQYMRSRGTQHAAFMLRVTLRATCYTMLVVAIVSVLAANPALAVGVGSVTGLIIGLSAQATVGNAVAGTVIALARPFRIGDDITVMGVTGRVVEVGIMHTVLDTADDVVLVPSATLMTQVVKRRKLAAGGNAK
jgi:small-conductance mechanosensitive channel